MFRQPGRKAAQSEATRGQLIVVATELFGERGYAAVGTEEIVRRAGVTRGALYHHFADKRDLFRAVHESMERQLVRDIGRGMLGLSDPWEAMIAAVHGYLDVCMDSRVRQITLIDAPAVLGWSEWREIGARYALRSVTTLLRGAMDRGVRPARPVEPLGHLVLAAMSEAGLMVATASDAAVARAEVEGPLLALLEGLRTGSRDDH